jgi:hypothetical protein
MIKLNGLHYVWKNLNFILDVKKSLEGTEQKNDMPTFQIQIPI